MLQMLSTPTPSHTGKNSQANASYSLFDDVMQALQTLQTAKGSTDIEFWVGETGWPTDGSSYGDSFLLLKMLLINGKRYLCS